MSQDLASHPNTLAQLGWRASRDELFQRLILILQQILGEKNSYLGGKVAANARSAPSQAEFFESLMRSLNIRHEKFKSLQIFEDPAWTILVDLYVSEVKRREVCITSACIASKVAASTALRWIAALEKAGLIVRRGDRKDGRRWLLHLTPKGHSLLTDYYEACKS